MTISNVRVVQGFGVSSFTGKKDSIKITLEAEKDDVRAGSGTLADVLVSLELHSTAADSSPISLALQGRPYEFTVATFTVRQDKVKVVVETSDEEEAEDDENLNGDILTALALHASSGTPIELTMSAAPDVASI